MFLMFSIMALLITPAGVYSQGMIFFEGSWSEVQAKAKSEGKNIHLPERQEIPLDVQEQLVIEYYSR